MVPGTGTGAYVISRKGAKHAYRYVAPGLHVPICMFGIYVGLLSHYESAHYKYTIIYI